jgi:tRNA threonylcarbamoyl adenosine modification protein (Sua5/YciO/YrdC/YwlC family)
MGRVSETVTPDGDDAQEAPSTDGSAGAHALDVSEPAPSYRRFDCADADPTQLAEALEAARTAVEEGECIVLPTDTVYGIGADAFNGEAVQRLLDAKMRGRDMPPPVLIGEPSLIRALATDVPDTVKDLVAKHWPGPLTVICKIQPSLRMDLGETEGTIALRVPDHALAREILRRTGPMAVSSANLSGKPAALSCDEAVDQLGDEVSVYLDAGALTATDGAPSTIVDFTQRDGGEVLRRGALSLEVLRATLPDLVDLTVVEEPPADEPQDEPAQADEPPADEPQADEPQVEEPQPEESGPAATAGRDGPPAAGA